MKRRSALLLRRLCLMSILLMAPLAGAEIGPSPKLSPDGKIGILGDSLAAALHASEMCGNDDAYECAQQSLGASSPAWSYAAANRNWSIASLLGFDTAHTVPAYGSGDEWKDAPRQAMTVMADPRVEAVFIGLGANNVCTSREHDYSGDLATIAGHIDATLGYLTDTLPEGGRIYWSGVLDVLKLRDLMRQRDHNFWFETCQDTWDLDDNKIKDEAANDLCDHFFSHTACELTSAIEEAKDELMNLLFHTWIDLGDAEGPCGKVLSSRATSADREEARQFNIALNQLMAAKASEYDGRNGVAVYYSDRIYAASANLRPYHVSRLDCFHPSRAGQLFLANETWRGFEPFTAPASRYFVDEFDSQDYCGQEYTTWDSCWTEIGENNGPAAGDIRINNHQLRVRDNNKGILRRLDLDGVQAAWLQYNWRREGLDNNDDAVSIDVSPDGGLTWYRQKRIEGDGTDYNTHRGYYHDITPYATADTLLRFKSSSDLGAHDKVFFDNLTVLGWGPPVSIRDSDEDGLPDSFEAGIGTDPLLADTDADGLTDYQEVAWDGDVAGLDPVGDTDPLSADTDADGFLDGMEAAAGYDPLDNSAFPVWCDINDDRVVDAADVQLATGAVLGVITLAPDQLARGNVAPLVDGQPLVSPDNAFNLADLLVLMRKVLGAVNF
jgi:hypothetical protein